MGKILWKLKYFNLIALLIAILTLFLQYFVTGPTIIFDEIKDIGLTPFDHEFTIKNSGSTSAKKIFLTFGDFYIKTENNITIRPEPGGRMSFLKDLLYMSIFQIELIFFRYLFKSYCLKYVLMTLIHIGDSNGKKICS